MKSVSQLLAAAADATPPAVERGRWAHLLPVAEQLKDRGFTLWGAVNWLIEQGEVPSKERRHCYHSLHNSIARRKPVKTK